MNLGELDRLSFVRKIRVAAYQNAAFPAGILGSLILVLILGCILVLIDHKVQILKRDHAAARDGRRVERELDLDRPGIQALAHAFDGCRHRIAVRIKDGLSRVAVHQRTGYDHGLAFRNLGHGHGVDKRHGAVSHGVMRVAVRVDQRRPDLREVDGLVRIVLRILGCDKHRVSVLVDRIDALVEHGPVPGQILHVEVELLHDHAVAALVSDELSHGRDHVAIVVDLRLAGIHVVRDTVEVIRCARLEVVVPHVVVERHPLIARVAELRARVAGPGLRMQIGLGAFFLIGRVVVQKPKVDHFAGIVIFGNGEGLVNHLVPFVVRSLNLVQPVGIVWQRSHRIVDRRALGLIGRAVEPQAGVFVLRLIRVVVVRVGFRTARVVAMAVSPEAVAFPRGKRGQRELDVPQGGLRIAVMLFKRDVEPLHGLVRLVLVVQLIADAESLHGIVIQGHLSDVDRCLVLLLGNPVLGVLVRSLEEIAFGG